MGFLSQKFSDTNEIHLITGSLHLKETDYSSLFRRLSENEKLSFSSPQLSAVSNKKIASRGLLREILAFYLNISPDKIPILISDYGKPYLAEGMKFNTSHAQNHVVYALSLEGDIGVDIETSQRSFDLRLVQKLFHPVEQDYFFSQQSDSEKQRAFFEIWTSKEAYLKALGIGIRVPLKDFYLDRKTQTFVKTENGHDPANTDWHCFFKHIPDGTIVSVVTQQKKPEIRLFEGVWDI